MSFSWEELPDINEVRETLKSQAQVRARLKAAKLELEIYQAKMVQRKQRDSSVKIIGVDEETEKRLRQLLNDVLALESQLDELDADAKFMDYRKEAAKIMSYKGRA